MLTSLLSSIPFSTSSSPLSVISTFLITFSSSSAIFLLFNSLTEIIFSISSTETSPLDKTSKAISIALFSAFLPFSDNLRVRPSLVLLTSAHPSFLSTPTMAFSSSSLKTSFRSFNVTFPFSLRIFNALISGSPISIYLFPVSVNFIILLLSSCTFASP
ncbi:158aa long hypothetical protein [Pyrococcus horikoshii OT3]|uniref:Uncharacterized protein n=1 Tax=Pyrococcus horikoshii (strain ATCC 700860 / DSM 12428 / JCM 9974 / NBRC 100139 / OT-3) TaxID=70601 RepID=O58392_PYRHO|nr:158aa long hypothetical protein [Pyrococcus horikoshii OT3]